MFVYINIEAWYAPPSSKKLGLMLAKYLRLESQEIST